jgi:hypothetical protein
MERNYLITRIRGGIGNQLFCYAAARRLAIINDVELVIDHRSGFSRDYIYRREYGLDHFKIPCRKATTSERLEPFERYRRALLKWKSQRQPFVVRSYIEQQGQDFDARLLAYKICGRVYLDGYWQSEDYFKDIESQLRKDLTIIPPTDNANEQASKRIAQAANAVALHVRWFADSDADAIHNLSEQYYLRAVSLMNSKLNNPHYFLFSDNPKTALEKLSFLSDQVTCVSHNQKNDQAYADMWLMSQCKHFITANSTFSWWGAWLSNYSDKIVFTPDIKHSGISSWGFSGLIPNQWRKI